MERVLAAGGGFLLAVLWFDLMFDVQVLPYGGSEAPLPEEVLASIAAYYRRVTIDAGMSPLVGAVMFAAVGGTLWQSLRGRGPAWLRAVTLALVVVPVGVAMLQIFPDAARLAERADSPAVQSALARSICHAHLVCFACIALFVGVQLLPARMKGVGA
jgi:hypothetical protein